MELNITAFFNGVAPMDYSASAAELGQSAGAITWSHAMEDSADYPLLDTEEKREAFRAFVRGSGGWNAAEIAAWSDTELNALCLQWIAGDMREVPDVTMGPDMTEDDWKAYETMAHDGVCSSRIFRCDIPGHAQYGQIFFSLD